MKRPALLGPALAVAFASVVLAAGGSVDRARAQPPYGPPYAFGSLGDGSWDWFADPRAVTVQAPVQLTFVGWVSWTGQVTIAAYTPAFGVVERHVIGHVYHDDHAEPAILVEPDGRLTAFWSQHNGSHMYYRTTLEPDNITAWGPALQVPSNVPGRLGYTYPNPVILSAEQDRTYLFWRGGDWSADYATRSSAGVWTHARRLIVSRNQRPYVKVDSDGVGTIAFAFTNGHPRNVLTSIYYLQYHGGALWTAGGRRIAPLSRAPVRPSRSELVYDARRGHAGAWVWDVALAGGHPVIVYATFPTNADHVYWYARWTGSRWSLHKLIDAGPSISPRSIEFEYSGGIALDHSDPSVVYLSRHVKGGWEIERWQTADGGAGWVRQVVVPADGTDNVRPIVPRGSTPGAFDLLWLRGPYNTYTTYRTQIEFGR